ncbi:Malectin [Gracilaria domingensis]|nr:Malectin [Gracilaria domingensis]
MRPFFLLCTVLAICLSLTSAQSTSLHVAFARSFIQLPAPYTAVDISKLSGGTGLRSLPNADVPAEYRSYAARNGDFTYTDTLAPGTYIVTLGFAEILPNFCHPRSPPRSQTAVVNGVVVAESLNVVETVGCFTPYQVSADVDVLDDGQLVVEIQQEQGTTMLSTVDVVATGTSDPAPAPPPPPSPSASASSAAIAPSPSSSSSAIPLPSPSQSSAPIAPSPSASSSTVPLPSPTPSQSSAPIAPSPSASSSTVPLPSPTPSQSSVPIAPSPSASSSTVPLPSPSASQSSAPLPSASPSSSALLPSPTPSSSPAPAIANSVLIDVGTDGDPAVAGTTKYFSSSSFSGTTSIGGGAFKTGRAGSDFTYSFTLQPGAYNIILGFAEYTSGFCSEPGKRVFNVYVNDEIQIESLDIYDTLGCFKGLEEKLSTSVGSVITEPVTIRFEAIIGAAIVSYINIAPKPNGCVPASRSGGLADGEDHAAHAVPGAYPPQINANSPKSYVDSDGDGFHTVQIDGSGSHSHFFDNANSIIGKITEYTWTLVETGEVLSKQTAFTYKFPLGTTRLKLAVVDNSCTTDEAETTVTVTGSIQEGMYCYYYNGISTVMGGDPLGFPQFAAVSGTPNLGFPSFSFSGGQFLARCFFFFEVDAAAEEASVSLSASGGTARVYKGEDLLLDTDGMASSTTELAVGLLAFEIIYERTATAATAAVQFKIGGSVPAASKVFYDQKAVKPILTSLTPSDGPDSGATVCFVRWSSCDSGRHYKLSAILREFSTFRI